MVDKSKGVLLKTVDMIGVSFKLQNAGEKVVAMSGGIAGDKKAHYFKLTLERASKLKDKKSGELILSTNDLELCEQVTEITPTRTVNDGLKESLNNKIGKRQVETEGGDK